MKKVDPISIAQIRHNKKTTAKRIFAPVKANRAKRRSASPKKYYTGVTLSTYKKFRMVIPNFL